MKYFLLLIICLKFFVASIFASNVEVKELSWEKGETFLGFLEKNKIPQSLYYNLEEDDQDSANIIFEGTEYFIQNENGVLKQALIPISEEGQISIYKENDGYSFKIIPINYQLVQESISFELSSSIIYDLKKITGNSKLGLEAMAIFNDVIDFKMDLRKDDVVTIFFERKVRMGKTWGTPNILGIYIETIKGKNYAFYNSDDESYYDENAKPLKGMFLKHPINYQRISSKFTHRRYHPVLNIYRPHYGVDYVNKVGTPIQSIADGKIVYAGKKGGYGRTVIVQHKNGWQSLYAHMNGYAKKSRRGRTIKQGDTIGFLGSSGLSSGPHLHFSMYKNHKPYNPSLIKSVRKEGLLGDAKKRFLNNANSLKENLQYIAQKAKDSDSKYVDVSKIEELKKN